MKKEIRDYIISLLDYLDGQGIVITDEELVINALKEFGDFKTLQGLIKKNIKVEVRGGVAYCNDPNVSIIDYD